MKKFLFFAIILAAVYNRGPIEAFFAENDPGYDLVNQGKHEVVLYATSWCGYCAKTRRLFKGNNIAYTEYDIEESYEGRQRFDKLGGNGVPLIVIGDKIIEGYNPEAIAKALSHSP